MRIRRVYSLGAFSVLLMLFVACETAPITGRRQLNFIGAGQEMQLGMSEFEKMKESTPISRDPALNELVQRVGRKIAAAANEDLPGAQWEFVVFDSEQANAFCLPGGKVGVYKGILPITRDEEGLAVVIGHEVAHAAARHGAERMSQALAAQTGGQLLGVALSSADPRVQSLFQLAYPIGAQVGVLLPYGRKQESEADRIGLHYMARAGYNPEAAVGFWQRFSAYNESKGGKGGPAFLRTHPVDEVRIRQIQEWLPAAKAEYRTDVISSPAR
ncbi:MAG TPA: M48 family metallopeptidase [Verrucomicrobiae bacterium]